MITMTPRMFIRIWSKSARRLWLVAGRNQIGMTGLRLSYFKNKKGPKIMIILTIIREPSEDEKWRFLLWSHLTAGWSPMLSVEYHPHRTGKA